MQLLAAVFLGFALLVPPHSVADIDAVMPDPGITDITKVFLHFREERLLEVLLLLLLFLRHK